MTNRFDKSNFEREGEIEREERGRENVIANNERGLERIGRIHDNEIGTGRL